MTQAELLAAGVVEMGLRLPEDAQRQMLSYLDLLQKWNKVYNLTAVRDPQQMVTLHLLDCLSVLPYIHAKNLLDVGSGAGLPGVVLAICMPQLKVTTIDTVQKKAVFMRQAKVELGLQNIEVVHGRVEQYQPAEKFDVIISRAFSDIAQFVKLTSHLLAEDGVWLAMKGAVPAQELAKAKVQAYKVMALKVAGLHAERHLIVMKKQ